MVKADPSQRGPIGDFSCPQGWGDQYPSTPVGKPWIRALGWVRTLGIHVLNKSTHGPRPRALQPRLTGHGSDHVSAPESWEPLVLTQQWYNFPKPWCFSREFPYIHWDWGSPPSDSNRHNPEIGYIEWGNWFHRISKLQIPFWEHKWSQIWVIAKSYKFKSYYLLSI